MIELHCCHFLTSSFVVPCYKLLHQSINTSDGYQEDTVVSAKHKGTIQSPTIMRRNGKQYNDIVAMPLFFDFFPLLCAVVKCCTNLSTPQIQSKKILLFLLSTKVLSSLQP